MRRLSSLCTFVALLVSVAPAGAQTPAASTFARHGHIITIPGVTVAEAQRSAPFAAQTASVLNELARRLDAAGSSLPQVVAAHVYLQKAADFPALNEAWRKTWPSAPPTRTTVVADLPPGILLMVSVDAVPVGVRREVVLPAGWPAPSSPYSYGMQAGDMVYVSGLIGRRGLDNALATGDIRAQTQTVLDNAQAILAAAGLTLADVVSTRVYLTETTNFQAMNEVYRTAFPQAPPARATVRTGLTHPDYLVEITFLASRATPRTAFTTPGADGKPGPVNPNLSAAIAAGRQVYASGMLGTTPGTDGQLDSQTTEALARIARTLGGASAGWADVYECLVYLTDMTQADTVATRLRATMGPRAAITTVGTGLVVPGGVIEIMVNAGRQE